MAIVLYDLVGRDDRRFSPHCWRTRMALAHKGLEHEARPTRFTEIATIEGGEVRTVPALRDGARLVADSWQIARYLEEAYPERPSLFGGPGGEAVTRFVQSWSGAVLHSGLITLIVADIWQRLLPEDQEYFRRTREQRFGRTLEEVQAGREGCVEAFRRSLQPLRMTLRDAPPFSAAGSRSTPTISCLATCSGRAPLAPSRCWRRTTRCTTGSGAASICTAASATPRRPPRPAPRRRRGAAGRRPSGRSRCAAGGRAARPSAR